MTTAVRPFTSLAACLLSHWCEGNGSSLDGKLHEVLVGLGSGTRVGALRDDGWVSLYTAVLRKVVPQKRISVHDNVERYYGYWWLTVS